MEKERLIEVEWEKQGANATYEAELRMICHDRTGLLAEISVLLASREVPIASLTGHPLKDGLFAFNVTIIIKNTQQLNQIIRDFTKMPAVIEVSRVAG